MGDVSTPAFLESEINNQVCRIALTAERACRIGRSEDNSIVLDSDLVSRHHAILQDFNSGHFYLSDLGSTNGTFVNGIRLSTPVILRSGDRILIGNQQFAFHQEAVAAPHADVPDDKAAGLLLAMKMITVLVVDVRDFTGLTRRLPSGKIGEVTGALFREAGEALQQRGTWGQKYLGDAVMALWVHEEAQPGADDFVRIFESLEKLSVIASGLQSRFGLQEAVRVDAGINTGPALIGNFGSTAASDYTASGDMVNMAFRLESATRETGCDLVMGHATYDFLSRSADAAAFFQPCILNLKGYEEPVPAYTGQLSSLADLLASLRIRSVPR